MRISDWSSDVCSSDLSLIADAALAGDVGAGYVTISGRFDRGDGFIPVVEESRGSADRPADYRQWSTRARAVVPVGDDTELQASAGAFGDDRERRSEEHTSELQSLMRISYAVFCLKKKKQKIIK